MLKAVIFDMDGVISHTNPHHALAFKEFFGKRDIFPTEEEFRLHMYGKNNGYILSHFFKRKIEGPELKKLEFEKESLFREIYKPKVAAISGLLPFLEELKVKELKLGVATSAPRANMDLILDSLAIRAFFDSTLAEEDVSTHKPSPEVYLKSSENLQVLPENCVVFEDSFSGATAGINAGMKVVGVLTTHTADELPKCDLYINDFELINFSKLSVI